MLLGKDCRDWIAAFKMTPVNWQCDQQMAPKGGVAGSSPRSSSLAWLRTARHTPNKPDGLGSSRLQMLLLLAGTQWHSKTRFCFLLKEMQLNGACGIQFPPLPCGCFCVPTSPISFPCSLAFLGLWFWWWSCGMQGAASQRCTASRMS